MTLKTVEEVLTAVRANPKSANMTSVNVTSFIKSAQKPLDVANNIIEVLGGNKVEKPYDARLIAQTMVVDLVKDRKGFKAKQSFDNGVFRAKKMRAQYAGLASAEDNNMNTAVQKPAATTKTAGEKKAKTPSVPKVKAAKAPKGPTVLKNGKVRGSMRAIALEVYKKFQGKDELPDEMAKALGCPKGNAYTHIYLVKTALAKAAAKKTPPASA